MASLIDLFKGSPFDVVKTDTETFLEQETTGLRVDSLVEINNPIFYGSDAIRIATKSTPTLNTMKAATTGELASGGLLGRGLGILSGGKINSLDQARETVNGLLGIPRPLIPTRVAEQVRTGIPVNQVIDKNGTEFGKFLQQTGGGSFENITRNAIGQGISLLKNKATRLLLGTPGEIGIVVANENAPEFVGTKTGVTYTEAQNEFDYRGETNPDDLANDTMAKFKSNPDLRKFSPIYGTRSGESKYSSFGNGTYSRTASSEDGFPILANSLEAKRGLTNTRDTINSTGINDNYTTKQQEDLDLIPFWISKIGESKRTHFRTLITGLSETVSPSWNSSKFFGNPFSFHTYGGVERSVTFNLFIYCMNIDELGKNWEKINKLTQYTYPSVSQIKGYVNPPIIQFRIGDIYNNKIGIIESISYTFPDNGTWEIDEDGYKLPKFIDASISIKFIEQIGDEVALYNYGRSAEAQQAMNDYNNESPTIDLEGVTVVGNSSNRKIDSKGIKVPDPVEIKAPVLNIRTGAKEILPVESANDIPIQTGQPKKLQTIEELNEVFNRPTNPVGRLYRRKDSDIKRELKFLARGQRNTGLS